MMHTRHQAKLNTAVYIAALAVFLVSVLIPCRGELGQTRLSFRREPFLEEFKNGGSGEANPPTGDGDGTSESKGKGSKGEASSKSVTEHSSGTEVGTKSSSKEVAKIGEDFEAVRTEKEKITHGEDTEGREQEESWFATPGVELGAATGTSTTTRSSFVSRKKTTKIVRIPEAVNKTEAEIQDKIEAALSGAIFESMEGEDITVQASKTTDIITSAYADLMVAAGASAQSDEGEELCSEVLTKVAPQAVTASITQAIETATGTKLSGEYKDMLSDLEQASASVDGEVSASACADLGHSDAHGLLTSSSYAETVSTIVEDILRTAKDEAKKTKVKSKGTEDYTDVHGESSSTSEGSASSSTDLGGSSSTDFVPVGKAAYKEQAEGLRPDETEYETETVTQHPLQPASRPEEKSKEGQVSLMSAPSAGRTKIAEGPSSKKKKKKTGKKTKQQEPVAEEKKEMTKAEWKEKAAGMTLEETGPKKKTPSKESAKSAPVAVEEEKAEMTHAGFKEAAAGLKPEETGPEKTTPEKKSTKSAPVAVEEEKAKMTHAGFKEAAAGLKPEDTGPKKKAPQKKTAEPAPVAVEEEKEKLSREGFMEGFGSLKPEDIGPKKKAPEKKTAEPAPVAVEEEKEKLSREGFMEGIGSLKPEDIGPKKEAPQKKTAEPAAVAVEEEKEKLSREGFMEGFGSLKPDETEESASKKKSTPSAPAATTESTGFEKPSWTKEFELPTKEKSEPEEEIAAPAKKPSSKWTRKRSGKKRSEPPGKGKGSTVTTHPEPEPEEESKIPKHGSAEDVKSLFSSMTSSVFGDVGTGFDDTEPTTKKSPAPAKPTEKKKSFHGFDTCKGSDIRFCCMFKDDHCECGLARDGGKCTARLASAGGVYIYDLYSDLMFTGKCRCP